MSDAAIVTSIVASDPEGLAAAYDKYAADLYGYCQSLLRESDDAADAVQDTFVIAASKLGGLRDPERLRAWLFAVARNECLHRLKSRRASFPLQDAPEPPDDTVDVGGEAERAETVALVRAAVGGLNDGERDVINQLWHGLEVPEVAAVLGVSRNHAYALFSRARDQLAASVGVLLVGRAGRGDCATLDSLLGDWDGRLTALLRKRVGRHIDRCPVCSDRRRRGSFTPALLYGLSPAAVLGLAALRRTTVPAAHAPALQAAGVRGAKPFGRNGFPRPAHYGHFGGLQQPHLPIAAGGTAVAAASAAALLVVIPHVRPAPGAPGGGLTVSPSVPSGVQPVPTGSPRSSTSPGPTASPVPTASLVPTGAGPTGTVPTGAGQASTRPATTAPGEPASGTPTTTVAIASARPSAGKLSVSPATVLLTPLLGGSLTLTASGEPVSWSISEPASLVGEVAVSPASGTLSAGGSVTVAITVSGPASIDSQLTVSPGGHVVTVVLGLG